jgi:hypothetical protein
LTTASNFNIRATGTTIARHLVCGLLLLPALAYFSGTALVGPYEGDSGLLSFLTSIYADALNGKPIAWALLVFPSAVVVIWAGVSAWRRRIPSSNPDSE